MNSMHENHGISKDLVPIVTMINDQPRALSIDVAAFFEKQHKHVIRDIRNIIASSPEKWGRSNFGPTSYVDEQGRPQPCFSMTRDGFSLLAMGFTGEKALKWKIIYIEAFNRMEQHITLRNQQSASKLAEIETRLQKIEALRKSPVAHPEQIIHECILDFLENKSGVWEEAIYRNMGHRFSSRRALFRVLCDLEGAGAIRREMLHEKTYWRKIS